MMSKEALRSAMRVRRRTLAQAEQIQASQAVYALLAGFAPYREAKVVMAYAACRGELSLEPVLEDALSSGKTLLLPRCEAQGVMTARRITALSQLCAGKYSLMEPGEDCEVFDPRRIDLILTPGTAFDRFGGRLGQGGGYYDRFFERTRALRVGVCHGFALLSAVPRQEHDALMDDVVTPVGIFRANR